jgi:hypothetical protein
LNIKGRQENKGENDLDRKDKVCYYDSITIRQKRAKEIIKVNYP